MVDTTDIVITTSNDIALDVGDETIEKLMGGEDEESSSSLDGDVDHTLRFDNGITPLDLMEDDTLAFDVFEQLESSNYEVLAEKKRKAIYSNDCEGLMKKAKQYNISGPRHNEIIEAVGFGARKKSRKFKKKGRRNGSKYKHNLKVIQMIGDANLLYVRCFYKEAIEILKEVIRIAPKFSPQAFHTLGLVYYARGDSSRALKFYLLSAYFSQPNSPLWRLLVVMSIEQGETGLASHCLSRAVRADPKDMTLRSLSASLLIELGDYQKAAESYIQISQVCSYDVEALKMASKLLLQSDKIEQSVSILEDYVNDHPTDSDLSVVDLLAAIYMESNSHDKALQLIERAPSLNSFIGELPFSLRVKAGICHVYLGYLEKAKLFFSIIQQPNSFDHAELIKVADSYMTHGHYEFALNYYLMLEGSQDIVDIRQGYLHFKIGKCHLSLKEKIKAISSFYKALQTLANDIDVRLTLAATLIEESRDDEAISLLSPPKDSESVFFSYLDGSKPWWLDGEVKLTLSKIYLSREQLEDFVDVIFIPVYDSLVFETKTQKIKRKKRTSISTLKERAKILDDHPRDCLFPVRPLATQSDLSKATRARKSLQKMKMLRHERKAAALAAGIDLQCVDSDDELLQQELREPPLPNLLKEEEHRHIITDLSRALASLKRYQDAFKIINEALKLPYNLELESLGIAIACKTKPGQSLSFLKLIVKAHPHSIAAWNCYYNIISRNKYDYQRRHSSFLRKMQMKCKDSVPPIIISGHRYTRLSQDQAAAREYLKAYKLMPDNPLINLCVGTSLINLALGFRLQNKHQCVVQGLAFLYNNLRICESSQESLFNIARAYHHIGLFTLAASYYEKVLESHENDHDIPLIPDDGKEVREHASGYCHLRREAAYNLHLIYKGSGAFDLAREVLKTHCSSI